MIRESVVLGLLVLSFGVTEGVAQSATERGRVVVSGVGAEDMLKLRAGPGTGFRVIAGLPEGAVLISRGCDRVGGTPWCSVRLAEARSLKGYVSGHYLSTP